jgi:hypothetical protein
MYGTLGGIFFSHSITLANRTDKIPVKKPFAIMLSDQNPFKK